MAKANPWVLDIIFSYISLFISGIEAIDYFVYTFA
jgi:hypothetical protein